MNIIVVYNQVKSKERVADHGEFFTSEREINAMLDHVKDETLRNISDIITSQIEPNLQDEISSELRFVDSKTIIAIEINKGNKNIYCQKKYGFSSAGCTIRIGTSCKEMTPEQIKIRFEKNFIDDEYMLKKSRILWIYLSEN